MRRRIDTALRRLQQDLRPYLDEAAVRDTCHQLGHRWRRDALLTPFTILLWFVIQVLHGNTALTHITLKARRAFTESAYCQARARLPLAVSLSNIRLEVPPEEVFIPADDFNKYPNPEAMADELAARQRNLRRKAPTEFEPMSEPMHGMRQ